MRLSSSFNKARIFLCKNDLGFGVTFITTKFPLIARLDLKYFSVSDSKQGDKIEIFA